MSSESAKPLGVTILDREFRVICSEAERPELLDAVAYLDKKMHEIRDIGKVISIERIAIMCALNITHELLTTRLGAGFDMSELKRKMSSMEATIDELLVEQDKLL